jgi:hypothetical protein
VTPTLLRRFAVEAEAESKLPHYYAIVLRDDNDVVAHHPFGPQLDPAQMIWARDVLVGLNKELHHDGAWVVVFTDPLPIVLQTVLHNAPTHMEYGRYALIWIDSDGDPQFTMEWINGENSGFKDFADVLLAGIALDHAEGEALLADLARDDGAADRPRRRADLQEGEGPDADERVALMVADEQAIYRSMARLRADAEGARLGPSGHGLRLVADPHGQ